MTFGPATEIIRGRIHRLLAMVPRDRLMRSIGWFCLAEGGARVSKLATTVVLARMLGPVDLGVAAIAVTVYELIKVAANNGVGQMVIRAKPEDLEATCNTAYRMNWLLCVASAVFHVVAGAAVAHFSGRPELFGLIAALGLVYLLMIPSLMPVYLLMRRSAVKVVALAGMAHVVADNLMTIVLALHGFGPWSIVLPKIITVPIWIIGLRMSQTWTPNPAAGSIPLIDMARFAAPIVASEWLGAVRLNLDKIIVWSILGIEALGLYYFAFNAGIGFSLSLTGALNNSIYPELARYAARPRRMLRRFDRAVMRSALPIAAVIALQAMLAFVYVPLVFGPRWAPSVALVAILCASAITRPFFDAGAQLLRASGHPFDEVRGSTVFTAVTLGVFAAALTQGLLPGILALSMAAFVLQPAFALWARRRVAASVDGLLAPRPIIRTSPLQFGRWITT